MLAYLDSLTAGTLMLAASGVLTLANAAFYAMTVRNPGLPDNRLARLEQRLARMEQDQREAVDEVAKHSQRLWSLEIDSELRDQIERGGHGSDSLSRWLRLDRFGLN